MQSLSDLLGYTSIACWLGAQFPQVLKNIRMQSSEGLALPFLLNWLLGDLSNLIGCILTHQLPFQTWLAVYFVCVDAILFTQYFYYLRPKHLAQPSFGRARSRTASATVRRRSTDRPRYRTLSAVAANVAAAAALAAQQEEDADAQYAQNKRQRGSLDRLFQGQGHVTSETVEEDPDENAFATLADSFHSEMSPNRRKRVSWSTERYSLGGGSVGRNPNPRVTIPPSLQISATEPPVQYSDPSRGRPLQREADMDEEESAGERRSSRASRRGAGMVFLSVWALFGVGTLVGSKRDFPSGSSMSIGRVLYPGGVPIPVALSRGVIPRSLPMPVYDDLEFFDTDDQLQDRPSHDDPQPIESPSSERVIGRIFAWLCTTLYLTSRLPQIWKNFVRKSVQGLSMYLFVFAFLGNVFYVASILSSPKLSLPSASTEFIRESIPYLLGSSGTLVFDITIVTQSFIYRPRVHRHRGRQGLSRTRSRMLGEDEAGLLSGDALRSQLDETSN